MDLLESRRSHWTDCNVIVTGGSGFVGSHLVSALRLLGARVFVPRSTSYDLRRSGDVDALFLEHGQNHPIVFHLAATVGGIGANVRLPATFIEDNLLMNVNVTRGCVKHRAKKLIAVGSVCAYPRNPPVPFKEESLFDGYPEPTNAPYGIAKRAHLVYLQALRQQYGFNGIMLFPTNMYGPGDNYGSNGHVIPQLIQRFHKAKMSGFSQVTIHGSGESSRDFLYVWDAVQALLLAAQRYDEGDPVNIGTGKETKISDLVEKIKEITKYDGEIRYNPNYPDGQPRRVLCCDRAMFKFGWVAKTNLDYGLSRTYSHYTRQER